MDLYLSLYQPYRSCAKCDYRIQDEQVEACPICKNSVVEVKYEWKKARATSLLINEKDENTVFLSHAIFPQFPFDLPLRLLKLLPNGLVEHMVHLEEMHLLEEAPFWKSEIRLAQLQEAKSTLVRAMKWETRKPGKPEEEKLLLSESNSGTCTICGMLYDYGYQNHLDDNYHMKEILPGIFLGAQWNSVCSKELAYHGIEAVLNCASEIPGKNRRAFLDYKQLMWKDDDTQQIVTELPSILQWIQTQRDRNRKVLVHCAEARSRSVAVLCALLMSCGKTFEEALHIIRQHKPLANPNSGFRQQLLSYESNIKL